MKQTTAIALACLAFLAGYALATIEQPVLIGYGCSGANGPLWAQEESDFPPCLDIHIAAE